MIDEIKSKESRYAAKIGKVESPFYGGSFYIGKQFGSRNKGGGRTAWRSV